MHVYALVSSTTTLALPMGVVNPLQLITQGELAAVVEPDLTLEVLQEQDTALLQAVLAHDRVIRELFRQTTVLPLRFTSFPTMAELTTDLQTNQQTYVQTLTRLQGKAEYPIKFVPIEIEEPSISPALKGKDYFMAKKQSYQAQQQQREQQTQELEQLLQAIAAQYLVVKPPDIQQVYILADKTNFFELHEWVNASQQQTTLWNLHLGEAFPPFHFV